MDLAIFNFLNGFAGRGPTTDFIIVFLASYLPFVTIIIALLLAYYSPSHWKESWRVFMAAAAAGVFARLVFAEIFYMFLHRPRPYLVHKVHQLITVNQWSFPSGHACFFFAAATVIYFYRKDWGILFYILALIISTARVMGGTHYFSDVLGGAGLGILAALIIVFTLRKFYPVHLL